MTCGDDMWCVVELNEARQHAPVTSEVTKARDLSTSQQPDAEWKTGNLANLFPCKIKFQLKSGVFVNSDCNTSIFL